jgi:large subunit ribosomal protein L35
MPKLKTNSSANKRCRLTDNLKVRRKQAFKSHILQKKSSQRKRALSYRLTCSLQDGKNLLKMLPYKQKKHRK